MKEFIMLVGECIVAVFTSEFDTRVTPVTAPEPTPVVVDLNLDVSAVMAIYLMAGLAALIIGTLVH